MEWVEPYFVQQAGSVLQALDVVMLPPDVRGMSRDQAIRACYAIAREELQELVDLFPSDAVLEPKRHRPVLVQARAFLAELEEHDLVADGSEAELLWFVKAVTEWLTAFHTTLASETVEA